MSKTLLLVNGPNLNLLGTREPEKYGSTTLGEIEERMSALSGQLGFEFKCFQSNSEGAIVDFIQSEGKKAAGMMINAGAYTHTSVAIRDAISSVAIPFVELHLTNVFSREAFRHQSYLSDIAIGVVSGFGVASYDLAMRGLVDFITKTR